MDPDTKTKTGYWPLLGGMKGVNHPKLYTAGLFLRGPGGGVGLSHFRKTRQSLLKIQSVTQLRPPPPGESVELIRQPVTFYSEKTFEGAPPRGHPRGIPRGHPAVKVREPLGWGRERPCIVTQKAQMWTKNGTQTFCKMF